MDCFNEHFLQFVWQYQLIDPIDVHETAVEIIHPGYLNKNAGPDFFNAKVKIDDTIWAGNIEIHLKSSDWYNHEHHKDKNYTNTVLHIVLENDVEIYDFNNREIPTITISPLKDISENYRALYESGTEIACHNEKYLLEPLDVSFCIDRMTVEKLEVKTAEIETYLQKTNNDWQEVFYIFMARGFGLGVNSLPFQMLAQSTPLHIIAKHSENLFQIETLLFGQSGLLMIQEPQDSYTKMMQKEYRFLQHKYKLESLDHSIWKFSKMHPPNFPTIRIAQLADLLFRSSSLFSKVIESKTGSELRDLLQFGLSEYWRDHYHFGKESKRKINKPSVATIDKIIINSVIPILFIYGKQKGDDTIKENALRLLEELPAEKNRIIEQWKHNEIAVSNAFDSQALIHLYKNYCQPRVCLHCCIGNKLVKKSFEAESKAV